MARQTDINDMCKEDGVPPLYVANWSGKWHDYEQSSIHTFKFSNYPSLSKRITRILKKGIIEPADEHCKKDCSCSDTATKGHCTCDLKKSRRPVIHECSSTGKCDVQLCSNRIVQNGRQMPLIIMRHHIKGYTIRLFCDVKQGEFVHEYVGEKTRDRTRQWTKLMPSTSQIPYSNTTEKLIEKTNIGIGGTTGGRRRRDTAIGHLLSTDYEW
ncbi:hypothetical protein PMAYCL1PPCAC_28572, partial [Pristionchus mayeri]